MVSKDQWRCATGSLASFKLRALSRCEGFVSHEYVSCVIVYASIISFHFFAFSSLCSLR